MFNVQKPPAANIPPPPELPKQPVDLCQTDMLTTVIRSVTGAETLGISREIVFFTSSNKLHSGKYSSR
jgi:hypothetical protein